MNAAEASAVAAPETVIAPPDRWRPVDLRELWAHRELIYFLTKRELQVRYKQSFFGISWAVLQPLVFAFIFALFFGVVLAHTAAGRSAVSGLRGDRDRPLAVRLAGDHRTAPAAWSRTRT